MKKVHRGMTSIVRGTNISMQKDNLFKGRYQIKEVSFTVLSDCSEPSIRCLYLFVDNKDKLNTTFYLSDWFYSRDTMWYFKRGILTDFNDFIIYCESGDNYQSRLHLSHSFYGYYNKYIFKEIENSLEMDKEHKQRFIDYIDNFDSMKLEVYRMTPTFSFNHDLDDNFKVLEYKTLNSLFQIGNMTCIYKYSDNENECPIIIYNVNGQLYVRFFEVLKNNKNKLVETQSYKLDCKTFDELYEKYDKDRSLQVAMLLKE